MRTDEGDEVIEPGEYELADGRALRVYLTQDDDGQLHLWACTHCQEVDGVTNGLLLNVIDGRMDIDQDETGEFQLKMTQAGIDVVENLIGRTEQGEQASEE